MSSRLPESMPRPEATSSKVSRYSPLRALRLKTMRKDYIERIIDREQVAQENPGRVTNTTTTAEKEHVALLLAHREFMQGKPMRQERARRAAAKVRYGMVGAVTLCLGVAAVTISEAPTSRETPIQTAELTPPLQGESARALIFSSPANTAKVMRGLGICAPEMNAQAQFDEYLYRNTGENPVTQSHAIQESRASKYMTEQSQALCMPVRQPLRSQEFTVTTDAGDPLTVSVARVDITEFAVEEWCEQRDYLETNLAVGNTATAGAVDTTVKFIEIGDNTFANNCNQ